MTGETFGVVIFWAFALATAVPAVMILFVRDVIRCAMLLLTTLCAVAGLFVLLGADFVGFVQLMVYVGGILILLLFGVMLTNRDPVILRRVKEHGLLFPGVLAGLVMTGTLIWVGCSVHWPVAKTLPEPSYSAEEIGRLLMTDYILPFEVISVLLLASLVGAAYIARMGGGDRESAD